MVKQNKKEMAVKSTQEIATMKMTPAEMQKMSGELTNEDFKIPRLVVLEALSPEVADGLGKTGDLFVKGLNINLGKNPVEIIVLLRSKSRIRWIDLDKGGGIQCQSLNGKDGIGEPGGDCYKCQLQAWQGTTQPECDLYENFIIVLRKSEVTIPIAISGSKARLGGLRDFNTMLELHRYQQRPFFDKSYLIKSVEKQNPNIKGSKYHVFQIVPGNDNKFLSKDEVEKYYQMFKAVSSRDIVIDQDDEQQKKEKNSINI